VKFYVSHNSLKSVSQSAVEINTHKNATKRNNKTDTDGPDEPSVINSIRDNCYHLYDCLGPSVVSFVVSLQVKMIAGNSSSSPHKYKI